MYLHIGQSVVVPYRQILGIFDLDNASWAYKTREFLERAEREGELVDVSMDLPKSLVLCRSELGTLTYLSQLSAATLRGRVESGTFE